MAEAEDYKKRFDQIQHKFDNDPALCRRFLKDPVDVLEEQGVLLSPHLAAQLQKDVKNFTKPVDAQFGIHIVAPHIHVGINPPGISVSGGIKTT
jgi:hypothetical protein